MLKRNFLLPFFLLLLFSSSFIEGKGQAFFQPPNISFETGSFQGWQCFTGTFPPGAPLTFSPTAPVAEQHQILSPSSDAIDHWIGIKVPYPDGTRTLKLGHSDTENGPSASKATYTFTIPPNVNDYTLVYRYALAFLLNGSDEFGIGSCKASTQPFFRVHLYNITDEVYVNCPDIYVAETTYPGVKMSSAPGLIKPWVKPWSSVMANLNGYAGKTFRLEFITSHCSVGMHFMYAYINIADNASLIKGNNYCAGMNSMTLRGPEGFSDYKWFDAGFQQSLGNNSALQLSPAPSVNNSYALVVKSNNINGTSCSDTFYTTIRQSSSALNLQVNTPLVGCDKTGVDVSASSVVSGSDPNLKYYYYSDPSVPVYTLDPKKVKTSGTYYIEAVNDSGCRVTKPLNVVLYTKPLLVTPDTVWGCLSQPLDLTNPQVTSGSESGLLLDYPSSMSSGIQIPFPDSILNQGLYFIRATNAGGCQTINPVYLRFAQLKTKDIKGCDYANILSPQVFAGSTPGFQYSYWKDPACTVPVTRPDSITQTGLFYIKGTHNSGCSLVEPFTANVYPSPIFSVVNPAPVTYPASVNLASSIQSAQPLRYSYWKDSALSSSVPNPANIVRTGKYYIKGFASNGCSILKPVDVIVLPPEPFELIAPNAFSPNGDGINDQFKIELKGAERIEQFQIFNRWGQLVYSTKSKGFTWNGKLSGNELPAGVYYWVLQAWEGYWGKLWQRQGSVTLIR